MVAAILGGTALLLWPAVINGGPILFSDTQAFLVQGGDWFAIWDKPFVYGPALRLAHGGVSLALPAVIQGGVLTLVMWRCVALLPEPQPGRHAIMVWLLCVLLAAGSAAPWFAALLLPDIWESVAVLSLAVVALGREAWPMRLVLVGLAWFSVAVHLSHLPVAIACALVLAVYRRSRAMWLGAPILLAVGVLLATNLAMFGRAAISPNGAVFAFARLAADGWVEKTLAADCPGAGWRVCAWRGRLAADSDEVLWSIDGPVWSDPGGPIGFAPEAGAVVAATLRHHPLGVAGSAMVNMMAQLGRVALGDVLSRDVMGPRMAATIARQLGDAERARFAATLQSADRLAPIALAFNDLHLIMLLLGGLGACRLVWRGGRVGRPLAAAVLVAILVNAAVTGALSGPHDRYAARITWVVLVAWVVGGLECARPRRAPPGVLASQAASASTSLGLMRTSFSKAASRFSVTGPGV